MPSVRKKLRVATEKAEAARQESEQRFQSVVENLPVSVHLKDTDGRYQLVNKSFEDWYGLSAKEAIGKTSRDLFTHEFTDDALKQEEEVLKKLESGEISAKEAIERLSQ